MKENSGININDERAIRMQKLQELRDMGINPYPAKAERTDTMLGALTKKEHEAVAVTGRLMTKRDIGKLTFCHLQDESGNMQIVLQKDKIPADQYELFIKKIDIGDVVGVRGTRFSTKTGEPSILVEQWTVLAKALRPLPDKFHGLQDEEIRLRKRYLDILLDPDLHALFRRKARFWQSMREFLIHEGFLEVETPILETTTGGADAKPFVTHHDALDIDVYLRISNGELWQKRLMVAGFEKTFELGRQFRNEGISREHLQDYSQMEFYWAYADYTKGMELVERLYKHIIQATYGKMEFTIGDFASINLGAEWGRIDYVDTIKEKTGVNILQASEKEIKKILYRQTGLRRSFSMVGVSK